MSASLLGKAYETPSIREKDLTIASLNSLLVDVSKQIQICLDYAGAREQSLLVNVVPDDEHPEKLKIRIMHTIIISSVNP